MNRRIIALSMACMTMTSVVACGDESKKSGKISDVAEAAANVLPRGYKGIIASDAEYSMTDSDTIGYRREIRNEADFDDEWLLISSGSKMKLYYADDWDKTAKGYKAAENEDKLTLKEIYEENIGKFRKEPVTEADEDKIGYVEQAKRQSANANAGTFSKAVSAALTDADAGLNVDVTEIGYIIFEKGKVSEINYNGKNEDELVGLLDKNVNLYFGKAAEIPYAIAACQKGSVRKLFVADDLSDKVSGCYPIDDDIYDTSFNKVLAEIKDEYRIEVTEPPTVDGGEITLKTGGDVFTLLTYGGNTVEFENWLEYSDYTEDECKLVYLGTSGYDAPERYDRMFAADEDIDMFVVEPDWGVKYMNDEKRVASLEALGFTEDSFMNSYSYTLEIGRATEGANAGKLVGASSLVCPAGFAYRTDLAEEFLGIKTPEEMQYKIDDWDRFITTACEVGDRSEGTVAFVDSIDGMFHAYSQSRTTPWVKDGKVIFDDSLEKRILDVGTAWKSGGIGKKGQWTSEWENGGKNSEIMGYFVAEWSINESIFLGKIAEETMGQWGLIQGPNPHFWGGTWLLPNAAMDNAEEAKSFVYHSCIDAESMMGMAEDGYFVNNTAVMETLADSGYGKDFGKALFGGQNYLEVLHESAKAIDNKGLVTPYDPVIKSELLEALRTELEKMGEGGSVNYDKVIQNAKDEIKNVYPGLS